MYMDPTYSCPHQWRVVMGHEHRCNLDQAPRRSWPDSDLWGFMDTDQAAMFFDVTLEHLC